MGKSLFELLESAYSDKTFSRSSELRDPFKHLVIGILSQNTNYKNSRRAYEGLKRKFKVIPESLAEANLEEIKSAIKVGGLYNSKARRIKALAEMALKKFDGDLGKLLDLPDEEARKRLTDVPGIGVKTADVFLTFCGKRDIIPIDTHLNRIAKRLGLVPKKAGYREVQEAYNKVIPKGKRARAHEFLIMLGREYCRARNPRCSKCPLRKSCAYANKNLR